MGPHKNVKLTHLGKYIWHAGVRLASQSEEGRPTHQTHSDPVLQIWQPWTGVWAEPADGNVSPDTSAFTFCFSQRIWIQSQARPWCEGWPKDVLFRSCHRHCISLSINFHSAEIESVVIKIYLKYSHIFGRLLITLIVMAGPDTMSALGAGPRVSFSLMSCVHWEWNWTFTKLIQANLNPSTYRDGLHSTLYRDGLYIGRWFSQIACVSLHFPSLLSPAYWWVRS